MANILITGGSGSIGKHLIPRLLFKGHQVSIIGRNKKEIPGVESFVWNLDKGELDVRALSEVTHIIHLAGAGIASGDYSTAFARGVASGNNSTAFGPNAVASGTSSIAIGNNSETTGYGTVGIRGGTATADYSIAVGIQSQTLGNQSLTYGNGALSKSRNEVAVGSFNTDYTAASTTAWVVTDRLFTIGNGTSSISRSDAMVVLKNGNTGFGTSTPQRNVHVTEAMRLEPSATAPASPSAGDMYFSSVSNKLEVYDGTVWQACW